MRIPIFEQIREDDEMCSDETNWFTPGRCFLHFFIEISFNLLNFKKR
jgi:hypothetical protein